MMTQTLAPPPPSPGVASTAKSTDRNGAAIKIQSLWRGHRARKCFPKLSDPTCSKSTITYAIGNDPISFAERHISVKNNVAILASGGVQCLHNAIRLTQKKDSSLGHKPMIFLMDYSNDIKQLWILIKHTFTKSTDPSSFLNRLPSVTPDTSTEDPQWQQLNRALIIRSHDEEYWRNSLRKSGLNPDKFHSPKLRIFFEALFNNKKSRFEWLKNLVLNHLIFIQNDWILSAEVFKTIKTICNYHNYNIVVYASNIHDIPSIDKYARKRLRENIQHLSPTLTVRTISSPFPGGFLPIGTEYLKGDKLRGTREIWTCQTYPRDFDHQNADSLTRRRWVCPRCSIQ